MRIQHNIMAMNAYRNYTNNTSALSKNLEKLSSGYKINRAGDDAAGLAISEKMRAQITGLEGAQSNAKDGISLVQTAEGALTEVHDMLNRMYELAEQSANGTYEDEVDRVQLQKEVNNLTEEIDRISKASNFNGIKLLDGNLSASATTTIAATAAASKASVANVDVTITADAYDDNGTSKNLSFTLAKASGSTASASVTASGAVTINLVANTEYDSAAIQNLLAGATGTGVSDEILNAVKNATVKGDGVKNHDGGNWTSLAGTTAAADPGDGKPLSLQIGDTGDDFNQLSVSVKACDAAAIGVADVDISTQEGAKAALETIKSAINYVSDVRGGLGAIQNRLDHTINNLSVMQENIQDAESSIRDTDIADEMMDYTKNNILIQSAQAMLAQANQVPQGVLQLLQ